MKTTAIRALIALASALLFALPLGAQSHLDKLLDECPGTEVYPQASVVWIYHHTDVHLDKDGFAHTRVEFLFKILDERAKDVYGDRSIRFDAEKDTVIIESAHTRLPNGDWIEPEGDAFTLTSAPEVQWASAYSQLKQQNISFPGLDAGAAVHMVYRIEPKPGVEPPEIPQAGGIELFTFVEPALEKTFTLQVDNGRFVQYEMQNSNDKPVISDLENGKQYVWKFEHIEQIISEPDMVGLSYLAPRLVWTTFHDWEELGLYVSEPFWKSVQKADTALQQYLSLMGFEFRGKPALMNTALWTLINIRTVSLSLGQVGYEPSSANKVWANRYGHQLDKAVLFTALLGHYGVDAIPVLIPGHDAPFSELPVLEQFGDLIIASPIGEDTTWIDLTSEYYPPGEVPYSDTYGKGCMLLAGAPLLTEIAPHNNDMRKAVTKLSTALDNTGKLTGTVICEPKADYAARARRTFKDQKEQEREIYFQRAASTYGQGTTYSDDAYSDPANLVEDFVISFKFDAEDYAVIQDDLMLLELPPNPFSFALSGFYPSLPEVTYPVDLPNRGRTETIVNIALPPEYKVAYMPAPLVVVNPYFQMELVPKEEAGSLEWRQVIEIKKDMVPVEDYPEVRESFQALLLQKNRLAILERK